MKSGISRWKGVPSYAPEAHSARKFSAVLGTRSQKISIFRSPWEVCSFSTSVVFAYREARITHCDRHADQNERYCPLNLGEAPNLSINKQGLLNLTSLEIAGQ